MKIKLLLLHGGQQMIHHWYKRQIDAGHLQLPSAHQQSGVKACAAMLIFAPLLIPDLTFSKKCLLTFVALCNCASTQENTVS